MTYAIIAILSGLTLGAVIIAAVTYSEKRTGRRASNGDALESDPVERKTYGLRFAPVGEIRARLPKLGSGHAWESWVDSTSGDPIFTLRLLATGVEDQVIAERRVSLTRRNGYGDTWARQYALYPALSGDTTKSARAAIVTETVEWAKSHYNKLYGAMEGHKVSR